MATPLLLLGWKLGGQTFGVDVSKVYHIEPVLTTRAVPRPAGGVDGVTFYQGKAMPVLNMARILLGDDGHEWPPGAVYMVMQDGRHIYSVHVDGVMRIFPATTDDLRLPLRSDGTPGMRFVKALAQVSDEDELSVVDFRRVVRAVGLRFS